MFVALAYKERTKIYTENINPATNNIILYWILEDCRYALHNPVFVNCLINNFSKENLLVLVHKLLKPFKSYDIPEKPTPVFNLVVKDLPLETLCGQARLFGSKMVSLLPKNIKNANEIFSNAIEKDGFKSLRHFSIDRLSKNKDLIIKAYEKTDALELYQFIYGYLNPARTVSYIDKRQQLVVKNEWDTKYEIARNELMLDEQIFALYEQGEQEYINKLKLDEAKQKNLKKKLGVHKEYEKED